MYPSREVLTAQNMAVLNSVSTPVPTAAAGGRRSVRIKNFDASVIIYVAFDETADNTKYPIKAGDAEDFPATAAKIVNVFQSSGGTTYVGVLELD